MTNAVLLRNVSLVVRDVSSGGCLIETRTPVQVGSIGFLEVEFEGERRVEWFRIARVRTIGPEAFLAGAEFLPLAAAGIDSLRSAVGRLRRSAVASGDKASEVAAGPTESLPATASSARKIVQFFRRRS
jgi:hypothetical protein